MKKIFLLLVSVILIFPQSVLALGLGSITVFSKLNEPLKAQIELTNVRSAKINEIIVANADKATYRRADLLKPASFRKVRFKIIKKSNGSVVASLTSKKPIKELYITFIADLKWKNIHLNREYTFLLDPATLDSATMSDKSKKKHSPLTQASSSKKSSNYKTQRRSSSYRTKKNTGRAPAAAHLINGNSYGPVQRNDTLSQIAQQVRPDKSVTAYQTMQALFVLNPKAFINNNINLLRQGQTLIIPSSEQILQIINNKSSAKNNQQSAADQLEQAISEKTSTAALDADVTETAPPKADDEGQSRLKIIPPVEDLSNKLVSSNDDFQLMSKTLKTSLETITLLKDTIVLLKKENVTLNSRLENLTEKLNSYDLKNNDLNDKIERITNMLEQQSSIASISSNNSLAVDNTKPQDSPLTLDSSMAAAQDKSTSFMQTIMMYKTYLLLFVIGLMLIAIIILFKNNNHKNYSSRNKRDIGETANRLKPSDANLNAVPDEQSKQQGYFITKNAVEKEPAEIKISEDNFSDYFEQKINAFDQTDSTSSKPETESSASVAAQKEADEIDLDFELDLLDTNALDVEDNEEDSIQLLKDSSVKEKEAAYLKIETYIAYGKYDSAEALIQENLLKFPEDKDLNIKLFEVYSETNQHDKFMQQIDKVSYLLNADPGFHQAVEQIHQNTWNKK